MESQHMTQQNFADYLGISSASLSSLFNDRTRPTLNHVDAIRKRFPNINLDWLMYGKGPMFHDEENAPVDMSVSSAEQSQEPTLDFQAAPAAVPLHPFPQQSVRPAPYKTDENILKNIDKHQRKITEIRVFYDDQTWETFVPKK